MPTPRPWIARIGTFTRSYFETALWSSNDESDDSGGEPLDKNYSIDDFAPETRDKMVADCKDFQTRFAGLLESSGLDDEKAGHYFWLSRNGHGAGFFDDDLDELQTAAEGYGEFYLYVGDDGSIHGSPLDDPKAGEGRRGVVRAPRASAQWTVEAGRYLVFNGRPFVHLDKEGTDTRPVEADGAVQLIAELFNKNGVTPDTIYAKHMGHPRKRR